MAYTSAALSYKLQHSKKPIAFNGSANSQFHLVKQTRSAILQMRFALLVKKQAEFYVVFDDPTAIQGTRAIKLRTKSYDAFESIN